MYLKTLQMQGFKSFPEKITVEFGRGLTAIVGPNGSGKSNISDAIRWVLGEQSSKSLRGSKMEDVIFSGTQKRRAVGAAEVSLTVDNTSRFVRFDCDEVTVTRRYFRSGESEYLVNKKPVRLRDIVEMFMDTGLGRDGYSVIGQGRIDEILSRRSEDRRELFEEAAGITKFRHRKDEAERKLAAAFDNLSRVLDIIEEISARLGPLEKRAGRAKEYLKLRDELKSLEVGVWGRQLAALHKACVQAEGDLQVGVFMLEEARAGLDRLYGENQSLQQASLQVSAAADEARDAREAALQNQTKEEGEQAVLSVSITHHQTRRGELSQALTQKETLKTQLSAQMAEKEKVLAQFAAEIQTLEADLTGFAAQATEAAAVLEDLDLRASGLASLTALARQAASEAKARASAAAEAAAEAAARLAQGENTSAEAKARLQAEQDGQKAQETKIAAEAEALLAARNVCAGYALKVSAAEKKVFAVTEENSRLLMEENALVSKEKMLADLAREYEGYSAAVKSVMRLASSGRLPGIVGTVGDLVQTENAFTLAIETALSAALQNIVTDNEETARDAIQYLKEKSIGRATFLPLSAVKGSLLQERGLENEAGFVGIAAALCTFPPETAGVFASLLGRTAVVERMNDAIAMARKYRHRFRIVTLDGQVINAGGSMTGGAAGRNTGILTRANQQREIAEKLAALQQDKHVKMQEKTEAERILTAAKYEQEQANAELREAEDALLSAKTAFAQREALVQSLEKQANEQENAQSLAKSALSRLAEEEKAWLAKASESEKEAAKQEEALAQMASGKTETEAKSADLAAKLSALQADLAGKRAALEAGQAAVESFAQRLAEANADEETLLTQRQEADAQTEALAARLAQAEKNARQFALTAAAQAEALATLLSERETLEKRKTDAEKAIKDGNERLVSLEREQSRLEAALEAARNEEKQLSATLWEQYELSPAEALETPVPGDEAEAKTRIAALRSRQKALGPVDVGSIDEFSAAKTRFDYLSAQKEDIEQSAEGLRKLIAELTGTMQGMFLESFAAVSENFAQTFAEIFDGGTAELLLADEENPLTCGIEIRAQPPGKNLKSISLLSGGEKSLVAIALYFALLKVQPAPFCVLDEIDAALDDVNVARFVGYLRRLSAETQFIVVTHRRGTMEQSDVLYGVTMQEQGVSRLLSLDLSGIDNPAAMAGA